MTGKSLKAIRDQLGLSQKKFAALLGKSRGATVSDYENGKKPIPETVAKLALTLTTVTKQRE